MVNSCYGDLLLVASIDSFKNFVSCNTILLEYKLIVDNKGSAYWCFVPTKANLMWYFCFHSCAGKTLSLQMDYTTVLA